MSNLTSIILGLIGLSVLVMIHEGGHFLCAHLAGIRVEVFSVGFGPKIWKKTIHNVEYALSLIPLGGYCKMAGETLADGEQPVPGDMYYGKPWRRALAVVGGPLFSFLGAWVFFVLAAPLPHIVDATPSRIVVESGAMAEQAQGRTFGFQDGDFIEAVDGQKVQRFDEVYHKVATQAQKTLCFDVIRKGEHIQLEATPILLPNGMGYLPLAPWYSPVIDDIVSGQSAHKAGILVGDIVLSVNGETIENTAQLSRKIAQSTGDLTLTVQRGEEVKTLVVEPMFNEQWHKRSIGVYLGQRQLTKMAGIPVWKMFSHGTYEFASSFKMYMHGLKTLFCGVNPLRALSGPVQNTYLIGEVAKSTVSVDGQGQSFWSLYNIFYFLAFISLALGVMNILPIPLLDGGLLVLYAIEALRGKYLTPKGLQIYQYIGLGFIGIIAILALGSDVFFLLKK